MKSIQPRIIAGKYKRIRLKVPASARPMTDRIKQSVFDSLMGLIDGARVLDLYAGSGNIGIEALSRGAKSCDFVEIDDKAAALININIAQLGALDEGTEFEVHHQSAYQFLRNSNKTYDLIFADPPFPVAGTFQIKLVRDILDKHGVLILRVPKDLRPRINRGFEVIHTDTYGESKVMYLRLLSE